MQEFVSTFFNIAVLREVWPLLMEGLWYTIVLGVCAVPLAVGFGLALAVAQSRAGRFTRFAIESWIDVFRSIPPLVLLIFIFYGFPFLGLKLNSLVAAVLALTLNGASYFAEIFRAGLMSVPAGQLEASRSTGMSWRQGMQHVVLPQGMRNVAPDLVSNTIELTKQTSIASAVALQELLRSAQIAQGLTYNPTPLIVAAVIYFLMFWPFVRLVSRMQNKAQIA